MKDYVQKIKETADFLRAKLVEMPDTAIILGSGLGTLIESAADKREILYEEIPHFAKSTVAGHAGKLVYCSLGNKKVLLMSGRFHYYEGYTIETVVFPVRVFKMLGINNLIITNAAGAVNRSFRPGELMIIEDHLGHLVPSPLRGENIEELGTRFPDMSRVYSQKLIAMAEKAAEELRIKVQKGVYCYWRGPMFETPAEIRMFERMGADAVGMSTVPEAIVARHAGMNILGISCLTNMAAGILDQPLSHEEVFETAAKAGKNFSALIKLIVERWQ